MEQPQQEDFATKYKRNVNIAWWLCIMHQRCFTVISRKNFGKEALGVPCALGLILMTAWAMLSGDQFMWLYVGIWLLCLIRRRMETTKLEAGGERIHSQYDGWPFDAIRFCKSEDTAKRVVEPVLVAILGALLYWIYSECGLKPTGLPYFVLAGVVTLPFVEMVKKAIWDKREQSLMDARIEQEKLMDNVRQKWGDS